MAATLSRHLTALAIVFAAVSLFALTLRLAETRVGGSDQSQDRLAGIESRLRELEGEVARLRRQVGDITSDAAPLRPSANKAALPAAPVSTVGLASVGSATAAVGIIEYTDFQCPYCRRYFTETWPELYRQYVNSGKVRYSFNHLPIPSLHSQAVAAAEAAECGHRQGKFWELRSLLFQNPKALTRDDLLRHGKRVSLDMAVFESCLVNDGPAAVRAAGKNGTSIGISATPTFLIGLVQEGGSVIVKRRISGAQPLPVFKGLIDTLLAEATNSSAVR